MNIAKQFPIKVLCSDFIQLDYSIGSNYSVKRTSDLEFVTLQQIILDSPNKNVSFAKILINTLCFFNSWVHQIRT